VHERLRFRVAQASVVFEDLRAGRSHHQTGVEKAGVWRTIGGHSGYCGFDDGVHDLRRLCSAEYASIAICAHATGVRAGVTIEDSLVILRGFEGDGAAIFHIDDEADLFARKKLFEEQRCIGQCSERCIRFRLVCDDDDALASGKAVCLKNDGESERGEMRCGFRAR